MGGDDRFWIGVFLGVIAGIAAMAAFGAFWTGTVTLPPAFCGPTIDNPTCVREWGIAIGTLSAALVGMGSLFQLRREHLQRRQREWENEEGLFLVHVADMLNAVEFKPWEKRVFDAMDTQLKAVCLNNYISRINTIANRELNIANSQLHEDWMEIRRNSAIIQYMPITINGEHPNIDSMVQQDMERGRTLLYHFEKMTRDFSLAELEAKTEPHIQEIKNIRDGIRTRRPR